MTSFYCHIQVLCNSRCHGKQPLTTYSYLHIHEFVQNIFTCVRQWQHVLVMQLNVLHHLWDKMNSEDFILPLFSVPSGKDVFSVTVMSNILNLKQKKVV